MRRTRLLVVLLVSLLLSPIWMLGMVAYIVRLKLYNQPKPEQPPEGYPIWPLWYVAWAFLVTRRAGALFVLGLLIDAFFPYHLD